MDDSFVLSLDDLRAITLGNFKNSHAENNVKEHFLKMKEVMKLWYVNYFPSLSLEDDIFGSSYKEYTPSSVD